MYELDLDIMKVCWRTINEVSRSRFSKARARTRQTQQRIDTTAGGTNEDTFWRYCFEILFTRINNLIMPKLNLDRF